MLTLLDGALVGRLWPPERVVVGMRTSKWIREQLVTGTQKVTMKARKKGTGRMNVARDLMRYEQDALVRVEIQAEGCPDVGTILHGLWKTHLMGWNGTIASLDLSDNSLGEQGEFPCQGEWLPEGLRACNRLSRLNLRENAITDRSIVHFASALSSRTNLTVLNLSHNSLHDDGAKVLAGAVSNMSRLFHLDVSNSDIRDAGISSLFESLQNCTSLAILNLSFNDFGPDGLASLTSATLTTLTSLDLSGNAIGQSGMQHFQPLLLANTSLSHLDVGMCELESGGAAAVSRALEGNTCLRRLGLYANHIGDRGLLQLEPMLSSSCADLLHLDLSDNAIGPRGAEALAATLAHCPALSHLDLSNNQIGDYGAACIDIEVLGRKKKLVFLDVSENEMLPPV